MKVTFSLAQGNKLAVGFYTNENIYDDTKANWIIMLYKNGKVAKVDEMFDELWMHNGLWKIDYVDVADEHSMHVRFLKVG